MNFVKAVACWIAMGLCFQFVFFAHSLWLVAGAFLSAVWWFVLGVSFALRVGVRRPSGGMT